MIKLSCIHSYCPTTKTAGAVGIDLYTPKRVEFWRMTVVRTGVFVDEMGSGEWLRLADKSGKAAAGLHVIGGIIDNDYTGELGVILVNVKWWRKVCLDVGTAICQMIPMPDYRLPVLVNDAPLVPQETLLRGMAGGLWSYNQGKKE